MTNLAWSLLAPGALFVRWAYKRIRNTEISHAFVQDMASNHLPHIYHALNMLCQKQGIELNEPPPIKFVSLNGNDDH